MIKQALKDSIKAVWLILFKPFNCKKWIKLLFVAWLAGALFGGFNIGNFTNRPVKTGAVVNRDVNQNRSEKKTQDAERIKAESIKKAHQEKYWFENSLFKSAQTEPAKIPAWYMNWVIWPIAAIIFLIILAAIIFFIWLKSRFGFIWLESIQSDSVEIGKYFRRFEQPGDSLMSFYLIYSLGLSIYFGILIIPAAVEIYKVFKAFSPHLQDFSFLFGALWPWFTLIAFSFAVVILVNLIIFDFIIPLMSWREISVTEAFQKWLGVYRANRFNVWGYLFARLLVSLAASALGMAAMIIVFFIIVLAGLVFFGILYLFLMTLLKLKTFFWILVFIFGIPFGFAAIVIILAAYLPGSVFLRLFSLNYLKNLLEKSQALT